MKWDDETKRLLSRFLFLGLLALMAFLSYKGMWAVKSHILFYSLLLFLCACSTITPRTEIADFYLNARFSLTDFKNQKYFTGKLIWLENNTQFSIQILGPLDIPFAQIIKENNVFCILQKKEKICGLEAENKLKNFDFILADDFKNVFKGEENVVLKENGIETSYFYEENKLTNIQFQKEKEWRLKLAVENLEF